MEINPLELFVRGLKIAVSNLEVALVAWLALLALVIVTVFPTVAVTAGGILVAAGRQNLEDADAQEIFLQIAGSILEHWLWLMGIILFLLLWVTAAFLVYFYVQGGLLAIIVRAQRKAPFGDLSLKPKLGFSPAMRVFAWRELVAESKRHGWRVTLVATLYSVAGTALLLLLAIAGYLCLSAVLADRTAWVMSLLAFLASFLVFVLLSAVLGLHYRYALACSIMGSTTAWEGVRRANRVFRAKPLQVLALFGLALASGYALAFGFLILSIPLVALSFIPVLGFVFVLVRTIVSLAQGFAGQCLWTAYSASCVSLCAQVLEQGQPARPGPSTAEPAP